MKNIIIYIFLIAVTGITGCNREYKSANPKDTISQSEVSTVLQIPSIDQVIIRNLSDNGEPVIVKDRDIIHELYSSAPYQDATPLGSSYDYNSQEDLEFYFEGKKVGHISVRITGGVYDIKGRSSDGPFKANKNINEILLKIKKQDNARLK